jgi:hypothetical protein
MHKSFFGTLVLLFISVLIIYLHLIAVLNFSFISVSRLVIVSLQRMQQFVFASGMFGFLMVSSAYFVGCRVSSVTVPVLMAIKKSNTPDTNTNYCILCEEKITALPTITRKLKCNIAIK